MKRISKSLVALLTLVLVQTAQAQTKHPLDQFLENCLGHVEGQTHSGCEGCVKVTREKWEEEVESNYTEMLSVATDSEKQLFRSMHSGWLRYKQLRFKLLEDMYAEKSGTWAIRLEEEKLKVVKNYAAEVKDVLHSVRTCHVSSTAGL